MISGKLMKIIQKPIVSEKSTRIGEKNRQFVFKVRKDAKKTEIKQAIEALFNVKVRSVNVSNVKGKKRNFKQREGCRSDWKKAYVALSEGFDINFVQAE